MSEWIKLGTPPFAGHLDRTAKLQPIWVRINKNGEIEGWFGATKPRPEAGWNFEKRMKVMNSDIWAEDLRQWLKSDAGHVAKLHLDVMRQRTKEPTFASLRLRVENWRRKQVKS